MSFFRYVLVGSLALLGSLAAWIFFGPGPDVPALPALATPPAAAASKDVTILREQGAREQRGAVAESVPPPKESSPSIPRPQRPVSPPSRRSAETSVLTLENFAVGYVAVTPGMSNEKAYPALMQQLSQQIGQGFQNYRELGQFPDSVGGIPGLGMRWQAAAPNTPKGDVQFFGRVILARKENRPKGVAIIMIATNLDPDVHSAGDVGFRGDLARILPTFQLE